MSAAEVVIRGNMVSWLVQFTGVDGDPIIPDAVSVFVDYRTSELDDTARDTIEIAMDEDSDGTFTAEWTTTGAAAGRAFWSVRAENPDAAEDGVIVLKANPANPDPSISLPPALGIIAGAGSAAGIGAAHAIYTELPSGVILQAIDGGPTYYADNGFTYAVGMGWDNPAFFPIALWAGPMTNQADADRLIDLNINTMIALGPSFKDATTFSLIGSNNISFFATSGDWTSGFLSTSAAYWVGNLTLDEAQSFSAAVSDYLGPTANNIQDHRMWYWNGNYFFHKPLSSGGGLDPYEKDVALSTTVATPNATTRHIDMASVDLYLFAGAKTEPTPVGFTLDSSNLPGYGSDSSDFTPDESARGSHYGDFVDFMRAVQAGHFPAPIGTFIENGGPYEENTTAGSYISPAEMNAAIWGTIIHGGRWFIYFNHTFAGPGDNGDLNTNDFGTSYFQTIQSGETISIYDQAKASNTLVKTLATVINSPFAVGYVTVSPPAVVVTPSVADSGFDVMAKFHNVSGGDNKFYIFAMPRSVRSATGLSATFTIPNTGMTTATVIDESRTISITDGTTFSDTFATGNTVHIYRIDP